MLGKFTSQISDVSLRQVRAEFRRVFDFLSRAIEANRDSGHEIYEMYVDQTTNELVIIHENGEKRIA